MSFNLSLGLCSLNILVLIIQYPSGESVKHKLHYSFDSITDFLYTTKSHIVKSW